MDQLQNLEAFIAVVDHQGFAAAAREMGLARGVVNRQVIQLEQSLGVQLLQRSTRQVTPTDAGLTFYTRAQAVLASFADAVAAVSELKESPSGTLRVNAPMTFGTAHLADPLARFMDAHPKLRVELVLNDRQIDPIEEGFDLTIRVGEPVTSTSLASHVLATSRRLLCASPRYLAKAPALETPADLTSHRCLHYGYQSSGQRWVLGKPGESGKAERKRKGPSAADIETSPAAEVATTSYRVNCVFWSNNGEALETAARAHQGIALLPSFIAGAALQTGELVSVLPDYPPTPLTITALHPRHRLLNRSTALLLAWLSETFAGRPRWDFVD
ncbi:MAG: LysR family transcriptional regulator [Pseudomonadota bacterium]